MLSERLHTGDTIGIISPSHVASRRDYEGYIAGLKARGFTVKTGRNLYRDTYGYLAGEQERADDLNEMVADKEVRLIFFGGGCGAVDLLPLIDYENIKRNPKLFLSYSDGTSILNAVHSRTGLVTYYGQTPGLFDSISEYDYGQFVSHMMEGKTPALKGNSCFRCIREGRGEGILTGGYTLNFALLLGSPYFSWKKDEKYLLFLEDHERFSSVADVSMMLSHIEQSDFMENVTGLLFGNYSDQIQQQLYDRLRRFGEKRHIPVGYCDDFGHGGNHAILPIGCRAALDAGEGRLQFWK